MRQTYATREALIELLSDEENARVSSREALPQLEPGDEYVDLENPSQGVFTMRAGAVLKMGHILPRSVVQTDTWEKIQALVGAGKES